VTSAKIGLCPGRPATSTGPHELTTIHTRPLRRLFRKTYFLLCCWCDYELEDIFARPSIVKRQMRRDERLRRLNG
jgi:hypothetical protein